MKKEKIWAVLVALACILLTVSAFFADHLSLYDFGMEVSDYSFDRTDEVPAGAAATVWFDYGTHGRNLFYGYTDEDAFKNAEFFMRTSEGNRKLPDGGLQTFPADSLGNLIVILPEQFIDIDGDGKEETVRNSARADFGANAFNPVPQRFDMEEIPFELVFAERNRIEVRYQNEQLTHADLEILTHDGKKMHYQTDENGWIDGLAQRDIRYGFTAVYSPDGENVYRMYYALEDYPFFSWHTMEAHFPLFVVIGLSFLLIALVEIVRRKIFKNDYARIHKDRHGGLLSSHPLKMKTESKFLLIRWCFLWFGMFAMTYLGKLIGQGQAANKVAVPAFACPFNLDQAVEVPCYYISHITHLFVRFGSDYPVHNLVYGLIFLGTLLLFILLFGRILCGFLCPMGLIQDLMDKLRRMLHIRPVTVTDKMNFSLQTLKWLWIILFVGFVFTGGDFCSICPAKVFATAQGGFWTNLVLNGFLAIFLLAGSFFIKRFWCLMCPMGYLMGLLKKFNLFKLKKDCTSCTGCGACYEACPMRIKGIYTEREKENVQTVDCLLCGECIHKCPEDNALSLTFCGKPIYKSTRKAFISKYAPKQEQKKEAEE
ncbi:MAG: 4Fe-4S binding protein [Lachnospiraceae bacterium]|nr:4Fe-4S binding protein [Lachnospiraceae bacterium]